MTPQQQHPRRSRVLPGILLFVALIVIAVAFLVGWLPRRRQEAELAREAQARDSQTPKVNVVRVERARSASQLMIPGTTLAYAEAYIYARASGYVSKRLVDIGDHVRAGQLLASIDAPDLDRQVAQARSTVEQSQAALVQMEAQLHLSSLNWDRYQVLVRKGVLSRQEGDTQEANFRVAEANVHAAQNTIDANRENLKRLVVLQQYEQVTAPFSGVVTARNIDVGALISASGSGLGSGGSSPTPGPTTAGAQGNNQGSSGNLSANVTPSTGGAQGGQMFSIASVDRLRILVSVPEAYTQAIHIGQRAALLFPDRTTQEVTGRVSRTSASIDQNTRTLLVEVQVHNTYNLVPGMYVLVHFLDVSSEPLLTIPGSAIAIRDGKTTVAAIEGNTVHMRVISLGRDYGDQTEISGGLKAGDVIATNVTDDVREGVKINPVFASAATADGAAKTSQPAGQGRYGAQNLEDAAQKKSAVGGAKSGAGKPQNQ